MVCLINPTHGLMDLHMYHQQNEGKHSKFERQCAGTELERSTLDRKVAGSVPAFDHPCFKEPLGKTLNPTICV